MKNEQTTQKIYAFSADVDIAYRLKQPLWHPLEAALLLHLGQSPENLASDWKQAGWFVLGSTLVLDHFRRWGMVDEWRVAIATNGNEMFVWESFVKNGISIPVSDLAYAALIREGAFPEITVKGDARPPADWIRCYLEFPKARSLPNLMLELLDAKPAKLADDADTTGAESGAFMKFANEMADECREDGEYVSLNKLAKHLIKDSVRKKHKDYLHGQKGWHCESWIKAKLKGWKDPQKKEK